MLLAATAVAVATNQPGVLESLVKYLGLISFAYMLYKEFKGNNREREKELQAKLQHLEAAILTHADQIKNAHQEREHLVKMNDQRLSGVDERLREFNTVKHDVELIKAEQKVMATKLDAVQTTLGLMRASQESTFKEILELIKKGNK